MLPDPSKPFENNGTVLTPSNKTDSNDLAINGLLGEKGNEGVINSVVILFCEYRRKIERTNHNGTTTAMEQPAMEQQEKITNKKTTKNTSRSSGNVGCDMMTTTTILSKPTSSSEPYYGFVCEQRA